MRTVSDFTHGYKMCAQALPASFPQGEQSNQVVFDHKGLVSALLATKSQSTGY